MEKRLLLFCSHLLFASLVYSQDYKHFENDSIVVSRSQLKEDLLYIWNKNTGNKGLIDTSGNIVVPIEYKNAVIYTDSVLWLRNHDYKERLIDLNGQFLLDKWYEDVSYNFTDSLFYLYEKINKGRGQNRKFKCTILTHHLTPFSKETFQSIKGEFVENMLMVKQNDKFGFLDRQGNLAIPPKFEYVYEFDDGYAVTDLSSHGIIDKSGKYFIEENKNNRIRIHQDTTIVLQENVHTKDSITTTIYKDKVFKHRLGYHEKLIAVRDDILAVLTANGKFALLSLEGDTILPAKFDAISNCKDFISSRIRKKYKQKSYLGFNIRNDSLYGIYSTERRKFL